MRNFSDLVAFAIDIISDLVLLVFAVTFLVMAWKIVDAWILHGGDTAKVEDGKHVAFVGVVALVVMSGIWGILNILRNSLF